MRKPLEFRSFPLELFVFIESYKASVGPRYGPYPAVVKYIVDGDTLDIYCDAGMNEYPYKVIRLVGVNTPELNASDPAQRSRAKAARAFVESVAPPGTPCVFYDNEKDRETFGRYIGRIMLPGMRDLSDLIVAAGYDEGASP